MTCPTCRRGNDTNGDGNCPVCAKYARRNPSRLIAAIRAELGPHLVKSNYRKHMPKNATKSWGTCYVATEALYHLWGKANGYSPMCVPYFINNPAEPGWGMWGTHWFLEQRASGLQVDITADQFQGRQPDYPAAKPKGFMTKAPSKCAQIIIDGVLTKLPL